MCVCIFNPVYGPRVDGDQYFNNETIDTLLRGKYADRPAYLQLVYNGTIIPEHTYTTLFMKVHPIQPDDVIYMNRIQPLISDIELRNDINQQAYYGNSIIEEQSGLIEYYTTRRIDPFWKYEEPFRFLAKLGVTEKMRNTSEAVFIYSFRYL